MNFFQVYAIRLASNADRDNGTKKIKSEKKRLNLNERVLFVLQPRGRNKRILTIAISYGMSFSGSSSQGRVSSFGATDLMSSMFFAGKKAKNPVGSNFSEGIT